MAHTLCPTGSGVQDHSRVNTEIRLEENGLGLVERKREAGNATHEPKMDGRLPRGFGRIVRDASGAVVDVVLAEEEMSDGEDAAKDKGEDNFEIEIEPNRMVEPSESMWLLENRGKGDPERNGGKEILEGMYASKFTANKIRI